MAGPCLGVLGWEVGGKVQRCSALRLRSDDIVTTEELLMEIIVILKIIEEMQREAMDARGPSPKSGRPPGPPPAPGPP